MLPAEHDQILSDLHKHTINRMK